MRSAYCCAWRVCILWVDVMFMKECSWLAFVHGYKVPFLFQPNALLEQS